MNNIIPGGTRPATVHLPQTAGAAHADDPPDLQAEAHRRFGRVAEFDLDTFWTAFGAGSSLRLHALDSVYMGWIHLAHRAAEALPALDMHARSLGYPNGITEVQCTSRGLITVLGNAEFASKLETIRLVPHHPHGADGLACFVPASVELPPGLEFEIQVPANGSEPIVLSVPYECFESGAFFASRLDPQQPASIQCWDSCYRWQERPLPDRFATKLRAGDLHAAYQCAIAPDSGVSQQAITALFNRCLEAPMGKRRPVDPDNLDLARMLVTQGRLKSPTTTQLGMLLATAHRHGAQDMARWLPGGPDPAKVARWCREQLFDMTLDNGQIEDNLEIADLIVDNRCLGEHAAGIAKGLVQAYMFQKDWKGAATVIREQFPGDPKMAVKLAVVERNRLAEAAAHPEEPGICAFYGYVPWGPMNSTPAN